MSIGASWTACPSAQADSSPVSDPGADLQNHLHLCSEGMDAYSQQVELFGAWLSSTPIPGASHS